MRAGRAVVVFVKRPQWRELRASCKRGSFDMAYNYPPGPMTGRGGPIDDGCLCADCPANRSGTCDCNLEELDDEGLGGLPDLLCDRCGCCCKHCYCYDDEGALDVEEGEILDALDSSHESGLGWDTGADLAPAPIQRLGDNPWVTRDLANPWPGEEGMYFEEQRWADEREIRTCANGHTAYFKPTVGAYVCPTCGMIYLSDKDQWIS